MKWTVQIIPSPNVSLLSDPFCQRYEGDLYVPVISFLSNWMGYVRSTLLLFKQQCIYTWSHRGNNGSYLNILLLDESKVYTMTVNNSTSCITRLQVGATCRRILRVQCYQNLVHRLIHANWLHASFEIEAHIITKVISSKHDCHAII